VKGYNNKMIELSGGEQEGAGVSSKGKILLVHNSTRGLRRGEDFLKLQS